MKHRWFTPAISLEPPWKILSLAIHTFDIKMMVKSNALIAFLFMECKIIATSSTRIMWFPLVAQFPVFADFGLCTLYAQVGNSVIVESLVQSN